MTAGWKFAQWQDGMDVLDTDLTNISRFLRAQIFDAWGGMAQTVNDLDVHAVGTFAIGAGGAVEADVTALRVVCGPGLIFRNVNSPNGADAGFRPYYLTQSEIDATFAAADPTNPRLDLVVIKIDDVDGATVNHDFKDATTGLLSTQSMVPTRLLRIQQQVVTGTPAPTPSFPFGSIPAGYGVWGGARIRAGSTALDPADAIDFRFPLGAHIYDVMGQQCQLQPAPSTAWAATGGLPYGSISSDGLGARLLRSYPPAGGAMSRLLGVGIGGVRVGGGATAKLVRLNMVTGATEETIVDLSATLTPASAGGYTEYAFTSFQPTPRWLNGHKSGHDPFISGSIPRLALEYTSNAGSVDQVHFVRWIVAGS